MKLKRICAGISVALFATGALAATTGHPMTGTHAFELHAQSSV